MILYSSLLYSLSSRVPHNPFSFWLTFAKVSLNLVNFVRSLHSPTFPSRLQSDSDQTLGLHSDSDRTSPPAKGLQISSPSPSPVHWSPSGIQVVLGIPRTSRSESTGSTRTHWLFIYLHISKLKIKCSHQVSNPQH
jgi:hypothetical protein